MRDNPYKDLPPLERRPDGLSFCGERNTPSEFVGETIAACLVAWLLGRRQRSKMEGVSFAACR